MPSDLPINLAKRNALYDLSQYAGFAAISERFETSSFIKFRYDGGVYALPNTQEFNMLFYRKDVFKELGLSVPDTWEDFYNLLPKLQRGNMEVGVPSADQSVFEMLLYQQGGSFSQRICPGRISVPRRRWRHSKCGHGSTPITASR